MKRILLVVLMTGSLVSTRAAIYEYMVSLDGPSEPTASLGTGLGSVIYDDIAHLLQLEVSFTGLTGTTTASHIHAATVDPFSGTAGVATTTPSFTGFPLGVTSGTFSSTLDLTLASSWNASYVTANGGLSGAESALFDAMQTGKAYWNIHSTFASGGEIRGFLVTVPEPSSMAVVGLGFVSMAARVWTKRRANQA